MTQKHLHNIRCNSYSTKNGYIQTSLFQASPEKKIAKTCILIPGYFSNTRAGPYGLHTRIAIELSSNGIDCITMDYLGTGESTMIERSFELDVFSVKSIVRKIPSDNEIYLIGHSISCAIVAQICFEHSTIKGIANAPFCNLAQIRHVFLSDEERKDLDEKNQVLRRGIPLFLDYIKMAEKSWNLGCENLYAIIIAKNDQYATPPDRDNPKACIKTLEVEMADHNFANGLSSFFLIDMLKNIIVNKGV